MAEQRAFPPETDPREAALVEDMIMDAMEYIHGKGSNEIVKSLENSTDTAATMAAISYKVVKGVADKRAKSAQVEMDMDMLMGVATEVIDMTTEVAQAAEQIIPGTNQTQLKEDTLLRLTALHGEQLEGEGGFAPEMKEAAKTDMRDYMSDGGTQKGFDYINARAAEEGLNPKDMMRAGNEAALGSKRPLSEAITNSLRGGLMSGLGTPETDGGRFLQGGARDALGYNGSVADMEPVPPPEVPTSGLMDTPPPNMPNPLPTGPGIAPAPGQAMPPAQDPNAEIAPPPERRY